MRILILSPDYRPKMGGVATVTFELARSLAQNDQVRVKVLAPQSKDSEMDMYWDKNFIFETCRMNLSKNNLISIFQFLIKIRELDQTWYPDVILNLLWLPCSVSCFLGMKFKLIRNIPYFTIVHGVEILESNRNLKKNLRKKLHWIKRWSLRKSAQVFSVSQYTQSVLFRQGDVTQSQCQVIYNGVDSDVFFPKDSDPKLRKNFQLGNDFVFLTVSRLEDYKGIDFALKAFAQVILRYPKSVYFICGEGPDQNRLEGLILELRIQNSVKLIGKVSDLNLSEIYSLCDVFVLLSREDWVTPNFEGFGIVLLEAQSCGKPCIAGLSGGMPEVVLDQVSGWIVDPEDTGAIVQVMLKSIEQKEKRLHYGSSARKRVIQEFQWKKISTKFLNEMVKYVRD